MKKLLILTLIAVLFLSACVQDASNNDPDNKETLYYTIDVPTSGPTDTSTASESVSETESEPAPTETESTAPETTVPETSAPETEPAPVRVSEITLSIYEFWLSVGESHMPIVTMTPEDAPDKGEKWESSDTAVATVDKYGNIRSEEHTSELQSR